MRIVSIVPSNPEGIPIGKDELLQGTEFLYDFLLTRPHVIEEIGEIPQDITPQTTALNGMRIYTRRSPENLVQVSYHETYHVEGLLRAPFLPRKKRLIISEDPICSITVGIDETTYPIIAPSDYYDAKHCLYRVITSL